MGSQIIQANLRMNRYMVRLGVVMVMYGLLLPDNWREVFGILGWSIDLMARIAPATVKAAGVSPIPELVSGFFGLGTWAVICFVGLLAWKDPLGARVRSAFNRGTSFWKTLGFIYLVGVPALMLGLWIAFFLPIQLSSEGVTWGYRLLMSMLSGRLALALLGSIAVVGIGCVAFVLLVVAIGPFCLLTKGSHK